MEQENVSNEIEQQKVWISQIFDGRYYNFEKIIEYLVARRIKFKMRYWKEVSDNGYFSAKGTKEESECFVSLNTDSKTYDEFVEFTASMYEKKKKMLNKRARYTL